MIRPPMTDRVLTVAPATLSYGDVVRPAVRFDNVDPTSHDVVGVTLTVDQARELADQLHHVADTAEGTPRRRRRTTSCDVEHQADEPIPDPDPDDDHYSHTARDALLTELDS